MGLMYFKRYRMQLDLQSCFQEAVSLHPDYSLHAYDDRLIGEHVEAKFASFAGEMDTIVFSCLDSREGCSRLMNEIASRREFLAAATWLCRYRMPSEPSYAEGKGGTEKKAGDQRKRGQGSRRGPEAPPGVVTTQPAGTIQGLVVDGIGSIQNLGVVPKHRGHRIGTALLKQAADGFRANGLDIMQLEVTSDNYGAIGLYQRVGFRIVETVFKVADIPGAGIG